MLTTTEQERIQRTAIEQARAERDSAPTTWIVVDRATGEAVRELFAPTSVAHVNTVRYEVLTALEWLQRVNREIKAGIR